MECVKSGSNGGIEFNYFAGGTIAPVKESIDALESGLAQVAWVSPSNEASKLPLSGIFMLPALSNTTVDLMQAYRKVVNANGPTAQELAANHFMPVSVIALPQYQIMTVGEPLDAQEKFAGNKIRGAGGVMGFTIEALGGVPVEMPAGDLYVAMQRGTVDSTIFSYASARSYSLQELVKSASRNASFGSGGGFIAMSLAAWDGLSPENQIVVRDCGLKVEYDLAAELDKQNGEIAEEFAAAGVTIFDYTPEAYAPIEVALKVVADSYIAKLNERGLPGTAAYEEFVEAAANH
jgi:TRAP-type transport system periplasmic protein